MTNKITTLIILITGGNTVLGLELIQAAFEPIKHKYRCVDVLVNNAGMSKV